MKKRKTRYLNQAAIDAINVGRKRMGKKPLSGRLKVGSTKNSAKY